MSDSGTVRRLIEPNRRILIVDDNRAIHEDFAKILGAGEPDRDGLAELEKELFGAEVEAVLEQRFELDSAYQGEEALQKVRAARERKRPYALMFVDVRMPPGLDGIQTTARLLEQDPDVGIVICSAYSDHSWEEMTEAFGTTDRVLILKKPFDTVEVRQLAHALQRRWELARLAALRVDDLKGIIEQQTRDLKAANEALKREAALREDALRRLGESHEQIRALAYQDGLTGLPNRRLLNEHLEKVLARARRKGTEFAVLFIDVDNFKLINDTIGHQAADEVLRELADSLSDLIRSDDLLSLYVEEMDLGATITSEPVHESVLSRLGGDEFIVLLPDTRDRFAAGTVARRILKHLEHPIRAAGQEVFVTASIGIATFPEDGVTSEILLRNADTAMYHAKQQGKAVFQYYSAAMNAASVERLTLESGLRRALEDESLELHYQPQVDVRTGRIVGAEALLRWKHPQRGQISPTTFIPIAEDSGLILSLGEWVMERACFQAVEWQRAGLPKIPIAVNVSGVQVRRQDLCDLVRRVLAMTGLDPQMLRLEITETAIVSVRERAIELLVQLRRLGVTLALDDFGTGYSSLSYLKSFPINMLKIDRSFVAEMLNDHTTASIIEAIISMTRILSLSVLAEGVEDQAQFAFLKQLGCDVVQGYYVSGAVPADEFARLLKEFEKTPLPSAAPFQVVGTPE